MENRRWFAASRWREPLVNRPHWPLPINEAEIYCLDSVAWQMTVFACVRLGTKCVGAAGRTSAPACYALCSAPRWLAQHSWACLWNFSWPSSNTSRSAFLFLLVTVSDMQSNKYATERHLRKLFKHHWPVSVQKEEKISFMLFFFYL